MNEIRNRVTESSTLVVFDLEDYFPPAGVAEFDLAPLVSDGVMREKTCREFFKSLNCEKFRDQVVAFYCSVDAILPQWIWPMASSAVAQEALYSTSGRKPDALQAYYSLFFIQTMRYKLHENGFKSKIERMEHTYN